MIQIFSIIPCLSISPTPEISRDLFMTTNSPPLTTQCLFIPSHLYAIKLIRGLITPSPTIARILLFFLNPNIIPLLPPKKYNPPPPFMPPFSIWSPNIWIAQQILYTEFDPFCIEIQQVLNLLKFNESTECLPKYTK